MKNKNKKYNYKFLWLLTLFPITILLQQACISSPQLTESIYSRQIYPVLSTAISAVFAFIPFSAAEIILATLILLLLVGIIIGIVRLTRTGPVVILRGVLKLSTFLCVMYFLFTALWGLNYYRQPLAVTLGLDTAAPTVDELSAVMDNEITSINELCPLITYDKAGHSYYEGGFNSMRLQVNAGFDWLEAPYKPGERFLPHVRSSPKSIYPSNLMAYTGIEGIFIPFTYEPSIVTDYPQFILPFTTSHETAHLKGYAREDEANYLAYLACENNPDAYYQYSGHMNAFLYLSNALYSTDQSLWKQEVSKLDRRAAGDINAYYAYTAAHESKAADTANKINDSYLKSQGQTGVVSYDNFVNLMCDQYRKDSQSD